MEGARQLTRDCCGGISNLCEVGSQEKPPGSRRSRPTDRSNASSSARHSRWLGLVTRLLHARSRPRSDDVHRHRVQPDRAGGDRVRRPAPTPDRLCEHIGYRGACIDGFRRRVVVELCRAVTSRIVCRSRQNRIGTGANRIRLPLPAVSGSVESGGRIPGSLPARQSLTVVMPMSKLPVQEYSPCSCQRTKRRIRSASCRREEEGSSARPSVRMARPPPCR